MKRESRLLFTKAVDSLVLSIEHHNRPWDRGRVDAVLILRRKVEAAAKLRALAIVDGAMRGDRIQPTDGELRKLGDSISKGTQWSDVFPGVAAIELTATGTGPSLDLRISKKEGIPIQLVPEGTPGASAVAVHKVDSLGFYNLGRDQVAEHPGLSGPKTTALIRHVKINDDADCYRRITIGKSSFNRYSQKAIERLREAKKTADMDQVWTDYQSGQRRRARA